MVAILATEFSRGLHPPAPTQCLRCFLTFFRAGPILTAPREGCVMEKQ